MPQTGQRSESDIDEPISLADFIRHACRNLLGVRSVILLVDYIPRVPEFGGVHKVGELIASGDLDSLPEMVKPRRKMADAASSCRCQQSPCFRFVHEPTRSPATAAATTSRLVQFPPEITNCKTVASTTTSPAATTSPRRPCGAGPTTFGRFMDMGACGFPGILANAGHPAGTHTAATRFADTFCC